MKCGHSYNVIKTQKNAKSTFSKNISAKIFEFLSNPLYLCRIWQKMTEEDKRLLNTFEGRLRNLLFLFEEQKKEIASLRHLLEEKEVAIARMESDRKELESRYANLKMARIISINDTELNDTKKRLTRLVREVEKCIALLNE